MKKIILCLVYAISAMMFAGDFIPAYQDAEKLFERRKFAEAATAGEKLVAEAPDAAAADRCHSLAARAYGCARKYDEGMAVAGKISAGPLKSYTVMTVMSECGKHKELAEAFKEENIESWPERLAYQGFYMRGSNSMRLPGDKSGAIRDLEKAAAGAGSDFRVKVTSLNNLSSCWMLSKNEDKALETANKALAITQMRANAPWIDAALRKADILIQRKQLDEAEKTLELLGREWNDTNPWHFMARERWGDLELARGNRAKAANYYQQAVKMKTHASYIQRVSEKLKKIQ